MAILPEKLMAIAQAARNAPHGSRGEVYAKAVQETGVSYATLMRELKAFCVKGKTRKQRSDKGDVSLSIQEAKTISAALMGMARKNKFTMLSLEDTVAELRANGEIQAEHIDKSTGEVRLLSVSAISRALRTYNLHPEQLLRPTPVNSMKSLHPNHCWQIDPSLCVLYYLDDKQVKGGNSLCVMEEKEFYKNKPANIKRIENRRVWRYVITDHASGVIYTEYVWDGETSENLCNCFIHAMQKRHPKDPFHGVPKMIMLDPGSANTSAMFAHLCHQLGVHLQVNTPGKPRAKGQVEKGNDIVERSFESRLKFTTVSDLDELNQKAHQWMRLFNSTKIHSRHGKTRYRAWLGISSDELVIAPSVEICRELMITKLETRKVSAELTVSFGGAVFDVRDIKEAMVGNLLTISKNPYRSECIQVQRIDENGHQYWTVLEPIVKDKYGFKESAAIIGQEYKPQAKSVFEYNLEAVEKIVYDVKTTDEIKMAKKAKKPIFGGRINPYKTIEEHNYVDFIPKRGQEHELTTNARRVELLPVSVVEFAKIGKAQWGDLWTAECYQWVNGRYPQGVPNQEAERLLNLSFDDFKAEFIAPEPTKSPLRLIAA
ncbi:integrase [Mannheimia granulomatis]|uniref:DDE-type integrase/transposase/recombinase n=1 Tax=Mannheimia granulomatis TaxID=85402 RepID=UPI00159D39E3|nr:DDE-type integrase/transposase/recombinase [Mannheimia granulomatis]QLB15864.1 integrase [Mannheimia granulomatis]